MIRVVIARISSFLDCLNKNAKVEIQRNQEDPFCFILRMKYFEYLGVCHKRHDIDNQRLCSSFRNGLWRYSRPTLHNIVKKASEIALVEKEIESY